MQWPLFGIIYTKIGFKKTIIVIDIISILNGSFISLAVRVGAFCYSISIILNDCLNGGAFSMIFPYVNKFMDLIMQESYIVLWYYQLG